MREIIPFIVGFLLVFLIGCNTDKVEPKPLDVIQKTLTTDQNNIIEHSDKIVNETKAKSPALPIIKEKAEKIKEIATSDLTQIKELESISEKIGVIEETNTKLKEELKEKETELKQKTNKILLTAFSICIIGVLSGIALIFFKQLELGMTILLSSLLGTGMLYLIGAYAWVLTIIAGVLFLALLVYAGLQLLQKKNIIKELVLSYEKIKDATQYTEKEKNAVMSIQSDATIKTVDQVKSELGK